MSKESKRALELDEKATEGTWVAAEVRHNYDLVVRGPENNPVCLSCFSGYTDKTAKANANLIAEYRTLCPELARQVEKLEKVAKAANALLSCVAEFPDDITCCGEYFDNLEDAIHRLEHPTQEADHGTS